MYVRRIINHSDWTVSLQVHVLLHFRSLHMLLCIAPISVEGVLFTRLRSV